MKYRVKVEDQWFEVEINDLTTRPVIAYVEGESFEIWPESSSTESRPARQPVTAAPPPAPVTTALSKPRTQATPSGDQHSLRFVRAPIPGVIVSIAVQPPSQVAVGQELCVLEAMKMRNSIRATRSGEIVKVNITSGQHVRHNDILMEFAD
jgi:biotin carboxyl carrier protein